MRIDGTNLNSLYHLFGKGKPTTMNLLFYLKMLGVLKHNWWYRDPRTNLIRHLRAGETVLALTSYNYGKDFQWFVSLDRLPNSVSTWKQKLAGLKVGEDCIVNLPLQQRTTWESGDVDTLLFNGHPCVIPISSSGIRFHESYDKKGTVTFVTKSCIGEGRKFVAEIFSETSLYFLKNFEREHPKIIRLVPDQLATSPI